jgi:undecaprenyl-phosphate 4-deoxy-4-formamido-L-arabinose transferase
LTSVSIVVPFFKSDVIEELIYRLFQTLDGFCDFEIIIVDDGSKCKDWNYLSNKFKETKKLKIVELAKNFGQHNAIIAGISVTKYELIATIDDDLQNPPEELVKILNFFNLNDFDLVYGYPKVANHSVFRNLMSRILKNTMSKLLGVRNIQKISSFRVFSRNIFGEYSKDAMGDVSLDAILNWQTDNIGFLEVLHNPRVSGNSNYNLRKLFSFAITTIISYSVIPLKITTYFGMIIFGIGSALLVFILGKYLLYGIEVQGFTTTAALIILFSGTQLIILGVVGEYLARMHLNIMNKPAFIVRRIIGFD